MAPNYQTLSNLSVQLSMRRVVQRDKDGEPFYAGYSEAVVRITDERSGHAWELTMDGDRITSLTTYATDGVSRALLSQTPLDTLQSIAKAHLAQLDRAYDSGVPLYSALDEASAAPGRARSSLPTVEEFAEAWRATPAVVVDDATGETLTRRQALHRQWDEVTIHAIDKWTRQARNRRLIPPAPGKKRGRPKAASQEGQEK